jgi:hypothetical protein
MAHAVGCRWPFSPEQPLAWKLAPGNSALLWWWGWPDGVRRRKAVFLSVFDPRCVGAKIQCGSDAGHQSIGSEGLLEQWVTEARGV